MKKGDPITIREIRNGVMIEPAYDFKKDLDTVRADKEKIAFQSADDFVTWIKGHFFIYEVPKWDDDDNNARDMP